MLVLILPIALIAWWFTVDPEPEVEEINVTPSLERAERESPYPVLRAVNLPEDWTPVRVAWAADGGRWITNDPAVGNSWQLGYLAPGGTYVAVQQRDRAVESFLGDITRDGSAEGEPIELDGRPWEPWVSDDGRTRSLVWRDGDMVAAVTADADLDLLLAFAGSLTA